ncbi:MAG: SRPBCC family protein [Spirochaetes bacterium]|nr:SRPBCC family protein [Spirochaetota bacterium]
MQQGWSETLDRLGERVEDTSDREMNISRLVDAPRELVWKVWTEPERIKEWWGPNGFTSTIHAYNLMPGGKWHLTMHGPDGTDFPNHIRFIEIIPNERLIYDHAAIDHDAPQHDADAQFRSFVYFADEGGKTRVTMRGVFRTVAYKNLVVEKYGALEGQRQHIARMAAYLAKLR